MAGDWIKMRADLQTHPKVVRIASALNADRLRVIGGLHAVWCLFDAHSADGHLDGYTPAALDSMIGWTGFTDALEAVAWLDIGEGFLALPRFDEHNGKSAKRRATEAERKRAERAQSDRDASACDADKMRTREEKRREEKFSPSLRSGDGVRTRAGTRPDRPEEVPEQVWADWLTLRKKKRADVTATVIEGARDEAAKAGMPLEAFLRLWCLRGSQGLQADWLKPDELAAHRTAVPAAVSFREQDRQAAAARVAEFAPGAAAIRPAARQAGEVVDITPRTIPLELPHA